LEQLTSIPNSELCCGCLFHWMITTQVCVEMISGTWSTMFDHKRVLVMSFLPMFVFELSNADMRLCYKACAVLLEWFLVALSHGKVLFSDECAFYCTFLSSNVFLGQNRILVTSLRCKTTHHTWW
jgi:hypothetical protein